MESLRQRELWALEALREAGDGPAFARVFSQIVDMARAPGLSSGERKVWAAIEDAISIDLKTKDK